MNNAPIATAQDDIIHLWEQAAKNHVQWIKPWVNVLEGSLHEGDVRWFSKGKLNVCANCIDRHLPSKANQPALIWEDDSEAQTKTMSFSELHAIVGKISNALKQLGIKKGDVVALYLPMIPEAAIAMLACARIGAVHTVVFAGFSAHALRERLIASNARCLITANGFSRGGKIIDLKSQADEATQALDLIKLVVQHDDAPCVLAAPNEYWWHELAHKMPLHCEAEPMDSEDPLFILYTSGSTGKPKGVVHTTGGYLVQVAFTHQHIFNCKAHEVFWCTADVGWITGHSYVVYGPLCNGITSLMYEGIPNFPDSARIWRIVDRYQVRVLYTAPTAIRSLMKAGNEWLTSTSRDSLRLLGSVGEPINPEAWQWYYNQVGKGNCPIVDTWWQTETGAIMISPRATDTYTKPGAATKPIPGIVPVLLDNQGQELSGAAEGYLAIKYPWPSMARTIAGDHARFKETYLAHGYYITGDGAKRDEDNDYWITGRVDDVINVAGHRLGTAEIESALVTHPKVAEAGVVGIPDDIKGQGIFAFVVLKQNVLIDDRLEAELFEQVKKEISAIAKPTYIHFTPDLPKTRSGKIMRRILRKIACQEVHRIDELGDLSTLANPEIVRRLIEELAT